MHRNHTRSKRSLCRVSVLLLVGGLAACEQPAEAPAPVDREAVRQTLLAADAEFSALAFDAGLDVAYERFVAAAAVQLPDGGLPLEGKEAIMSNVLAVVAENDFRLSWEALDAVVAASGELGYTWGNYFLEGTDANGETYVADGKYASFWQYTEAAGWQVVLDTSNQNEPPFAEELEFDFLPPATTEFDQGLAD